MAGKGIFITGTDTGVGKSIVSAALARLLYEHGLNVGVMKPVTSGCGERNNRLISEDAELLTWGARLPGVDADIAPYILRDPMAPSEAASRQGTTLDFPLIGDAFARLADRHDFVIVEGAGGLMVPLSGASLVADLVNYLRLPLLVVARPGLGTVNHTLLTCSMARRLGITVRGVIINDFPEHPDMAEQAAPRLIGSLAGTPFVNVFPHIEGENSREIVTRLVARLAGEPAISSMLLEIGAL